MENSVRIAVLVESSRGYGRGLLRGIAGYARTRRNWSLFVQERALADNAPSWLDRHWQCDGVLARIESLQVLKSLVAKKVPIVDLRGRIPQPNIPVVEGDDEAIVRMACDHLLGKGLRRFAFCGFSGIDYSERRQALTLQYLSARGFQVEVANSPPSRHSHTSDIEATGMMHESELAECLAAIERPAGIVACNDIRAAQVIDACRHCSLAVPDDFAIVGVDNDELICETTSPPLSSVEIDTYRIGFMACEMLADMMAGKAPDSSRMLIQPLGVTERRSTDTLAIDDPDVSRALRFIRDHACDGIKVVDVANHVAVSRSALDRKFARLLDTTVKSHINRVRLAYVRRLLVDTDYKLVAIARMAGFQHHEYLSAKFKHEFGITMNGYRRTFRSQSRR